MYNTSNLAIKEIQEVPVQSDSQVTVGTDNIVKLDLSRFDSRDMVQEAIRMEMTLLIVFFIILFIIFLLLYQMVLEE